MRRTVLFLFIVLSGAPGLHAQDTLPPEPAVIATDTVSWEAFAHDTLAVREARIDTAAISRYRIDPDLDYDRSFRTQELIGERFKRWLLELLARLFGNRAGMWVISHLHWLILGIAVVLLLFFFRRHLFGAFLTGDPARNRQVTEVEEDIANVDLDALLAKAERDRDWRLAVRYQYLRVLRRLVDEGRITWQPRYTDQDYLGQLTDPALRRSFSDISFLFKWVWYGEGAVDAARYGQVRTAFEAFLTRPAR